MYVDESKLKIRLSFKLLLYGDVEVIRCLHSHMHFLDDSAVSVSFFSFLD